MLLCIVYVVYIQIMCIGYSHNAFCAFQPPHPAPLAPTAAPQSSIVRPPKRARLEQTNPLNSQGRQQTILQVTVSQDRERMGDNMLGWISIPLFSPGNTFFPAIQLASVGISNLAFGSRSDLRYIPTLRTYLYYERSYSKNVFLFAGSGAEATD